MKALIFSLLTIFSLTACGTSTLYNPISYDQDLYAAQLCTIADPNNPGQRVRAPEDYCVDTEDNDTYYAYHEYPYSTSDIDVVYVGYPVDNRRWVRQRPARVDYAHFDRGRFPADPPPGVKPSGPSYKYSTLALDNDTRNAAKRTEFKKSVTGRVIERGGLGIPERVAPRASQSQRAATPGTPSRILPPKPAPSKPSAIAASSTSGSWTGIGNPARNSSSSSSSGSSSSTSGGSKSSSSSSSSSTSGSSSRTSSSSSGGFKSK